MVGLVLVIIIVIVTISVFAFLALRSTSTAGLLYLYFGSVLAYGQFIMHINMFGNRALQIPAQRTTYETLHLM
jgi:hypothetical protein